MNCKTCGKPTQPNKYGKFPKTHEGDCRSKYKSKMSSENVKRGKVSNNRGRSY